ncbi:hypothetical protein ACLESO_52230 [Pyxidicoccus sp. 3LG]
MVVGFLASRTGRWLRIVTGAGMMLGGLASGTTKGTVVALAGLGTLMAASLDLVPVAPLFGLPVRGEDLRRELGVTEDAELLDGLPSPASRASTTIH